MSSSDRAVDRKESGRDRENHPSRMGMPRPSATLPSAPPIFQTSAFDVPDLNVLQAMARGETQGHIYTRDSNPNHSALAETIAFLEGTESGAVFASGMGALASVFLTLAGRGDHVVIASSLYGRTRQLAERMRQQYGIAITAVDVSRVESFRTAVTPQTKFAVVETISNPLLRVADVAAIASALESVPLVVDATFTTPELSQPCRQGAAITVHSASKYLSGHGDVMLGVAAGTCEMMARLTETASIFGQNANPFEAWLCQRGLRTLELRMRQICRTATELAGILEKHPAIRRVYHPLLAGHPDYSLARRLYPDGTGGIVAFELREGGAAAVSRFMQHSESIPFSPTLADARTTISYPAGTSHRFLTSEERAETGITDELIRLSAGLEPIELLERDLRQALDAVFR